jgi:hypothetical protein
MCVQPLHPALYQVQKSNIFIEVVTGTQRRFCCAGRTSTLYRSGVSVAPVEPVRYTGYQNL